MIKCNIKKEFNCSIEKIWEIVIDNSNYFWRSDLSKIEVLDDKNFIEYTKNNYPTYFTITEKIDFERYCFEIKNTNIKGSWIGVFIKVDTDKTILDFTEYIETKNIVFKLLAKPYLKSQQKLYMKDLEKALKDSK